jgi:heme a synthase
MRHHNAGLVIPDFPLSNGRLIPEFTSWQIAINFTHRVLAFTILGVAIANAVVIWDGTVADRFLKRAMGAVLLLIFVQICLGVFTVWSIAAPVPTTLHVTNGAMVLASSVVLCLRALYLRRLTTAPSAPGHGIPDLVEANGV